MDTLVSKAPDGEELDAYILGVDVAVETFTGKRITIIHRTNNDDDKLIIIPEGLSQSDVEIQAAIAFQEKYF